MASVFLIYCPPMEGGGDPYVRDVASSVDVAKQIVEKNLPAGLVHPDGAYWQEFKSSGPSVWRLGDGKVSSWFQLPFIREKIVKEAA